MDCFKRDCYFRSNATSNINNCDRWNCQDRASFLNTISYTNNTDTFPYPKGHWIRKNFETGYECSKCGSRCLLDYESDWCTSQFCPHCGAKMEVTENSFNNF